MMSKCTDGCEWKVWHVGMEWGIQCTECFECMEDDELERRLNEYETLKAATERLSADDARFISNENMSLVKRKKLRAYADILEQQ